MLLVAFITFRWRQMDRKTRIQIDFNYHQFILEYGSEYETFLLFFY